MPPKKSSPKRSKPARVTPGEIENLSPDKLRLDLTNPRFGLAKAHDEDEALNMLIENADLKELWDSISERGYEKFEPLVAMKERGATIVLEGNRRLAAVKLLLHPEKLKPALRKRIPEISPAHLQSCKKLPVIVVPNRAAAAGYIGFKHVNGPARWTSLAKAKFGVEFFEGLKGSDPEERLGSVIKQLGDSRGLIIRLLVAYKIVQQAVSEGFLEALGIDENMIEFSHLYTMINNPETREFIGLDRTPLNESMIVNNPIPKSHLRYLRELLGWLYGPKSVIKSQGSDRPKLQRVLANAEAVKELRTSGELSSAVAVAGLQNEDWLETLAKIANLALALNTQSAVVAPRLSEEEQSQALSLCKRTETTIRQIRTAFIEA